MTSFDVARHCRHCGRHIVARQEPRVDPKVGPGVHVEKTVWYHKWSDRRYCLVRNMQGGYPKWKGKMASPKPLDTVGVDR